MRQIPFRFMKALLVEIETKEIITAYCHASTVIQPCNRIKCLGQRVLVYDTSDGSLIQPLKGHKASIFLPF
jgi:hypothetical protein